MHIPEENRHEQASEQCVYTSLIYLQIYSVKVREANDTKEYSTYVMHSASYNLFKHA